jgi:hypothetical protein
MGSTIVRSEGGVLSVGVSSSFSATVAQAMPATDAAARPTTAARCCLGRAEQTRHTASPRVTSSARSAAAPDLTSASGETRRPNLREADTWALAIIRRT